MKVVESPSHNNEVVAFVITGDGETERKVLKFIANRYNGKKQGFSFSKKLISKENRVKYLECH